MQIRCDLLIEMVRTRLVVNVIHEILRNNALHLYTMAVSRFGNHIKSLDFFFQFQRASTAFHSNKQKTVYNTKFILLEEPKIYVLAFIFS